jgi:hypothetical protein
MSEDKKPVSIEDLIFSHTFSISALMNVLEKKGLVLKDEVLAEVDRLKREMDEKVKKN